MIRWPLALVLLLLTFAPAPASHADAPNPIAGETRQWHQWILPNGLKLVVVEDHRLPVAAYRMLIRAGAGDENTGESGYAHLLEHMMFQGSRKMPPGTYARTLESSGAIYNATTDYDRTDYFAVVPVHWLQRALWLEGERLTEPTFGKKQVVLQRAAVLEETEMRINNTPYVGALASFLTVALKGTRYGHLLTGSADDIHGANRQRLLKFYRTHYTPNRMILAVVGDVDAKQVHAWVKTSFGQLPPQKDDLTDTWRKALRLPGQSTTLRDPLAPWPIHVIVWSLPGRAQRTAAVWQFVYDALMLPGRGLKDFLIEDKELAFTTMQVRYPMWQLNAANQIVIPRAFVSTDRLRRAFEQWRTKSRRQPLTAEELENAKKHYKSSLAASLDDFMETASIASDHWLLYGSPMAWREQWQQIDQLTVEDANRIAENILTEEPLWLTVEPESWWLRTGKHVLECLPDSLGEAVESWVF